MESKIFGLENVNKNNVLLIFNLGDINKINQTKQKLENNLYKSPEEIILQKCFVNGSLIITNDFENYINIKPFTTYVKAQVWDKNKLFKNYKNICEQYPLIPDEFYSQAFVINEINKYEKLEPLEIALLFNTSLTTAYKIYNLANTNFNLIQTFATNYCAIDYVNFLVKNYNPEVLEYAINNIIQQKISLYEIPNVINEMYSNIEE